jgi:ubiquinone/menaquinone biosynthesis C-methylase UbiE
VLSAIMAPVRLPPHQEHTVNLAPEYTQGRYDEVASDYDRLWSRHMAGPQTRLTAGLRLAPGDRLADVACGTGLVTLDMARQTRPGYVVAVDYSENMLEATRRLLGAEGIPVRLVHAQAEHFVDHAEPASFDVVSCRFAMAYVDWRAMLPRIARLLRPGGRVGILNSTSGSLPQGFRVYERLRDSPRTMWKLLRHFRNDVGHAWSLYRQLRQAFGTAAFITVPHGPDQVAALLEEGGLQRREAWTEVVRLWFGSGREAITWLDESGYATHPGLRDVPGPGIRFLMEIFAAGLDELRTERGLPLDIVISGVVAERPA